MHGLHDRPCRPCRRVQRNTCNTWPSAAVTFFFPRHSRRRRLLRQMRQSLAAERRVHRHAVGGNPSRWQLCTYCAVGERSLAASPPLPCRCPKPTGHRSGHPPEGHAPPPCKMIATTRQQELPSYSTAHEFRAEVPAEITICTSGHSRTTHFPDSHSSADGRPLYLPQTTQTNITDE